MTQQPNRIAIFVVISLALLMTSLDQTIVATALHSLQRDLGSSITWASWTITVYSLGLIIMLPLAGRLSDRHGRRRVFLASVIVFSVASLCCGLANNIYVLVALRAVQAIGGAGFTPSATGIVVEHFGEARDKAVGLFGSIFPIGSMIGPIFGGLFVVYWSWRGIFLVNVPLGALLVVLCLRYIPPDAPRPAAQAGRLDASGMALLGTGILTGMLAISYLGEAHARPWSPLFAGPILASAILLWLFWRHIVRSDDPLISPRFVAGHGFGAVNTVNLFYTGAVAGLVTLVPLYAVNRYHLSALDSGTLLTAQAVAVIAVSSTAAFSLRRTGYRKPIYVGMVIVAIGMFGLAVTPVHLSSYAWLAVATCLVGIGTGGANPASRNAGLQLAPEASASIAALRSMGRQTGLITSISIATAIIAQADNPGATQGHVYLVFGALVLLGLPIIRRIPEHRGAW